MSFLRNIILILFPFFLIPPAFADNPETLGQVQFSAYGSTNKNETGLFSTDFILPLYYTLDKDTLLFYNPKDTYSTPHANEFHQGLGLRHIFDDSFILGINAFFDRRQDVSEAWFSQTGVGLEYLSDPLDIRLNWYKPTTGVKTVDTTYGFGSTGLIQYDQKQEPLQGLDFEIGVPVFDRYTKTRLYLGGDFYQSRLSKNVSGFRARTETSITQWLSFDTNFNSNINKKVEFYGGLRFTLAFDLSNLFNRTGKPVFTSPTVQGSKNTYLQNRLFERVVRDIDVQSSTSTVQSKGQGLVYVNNLNTGAQDGTREHPYNTIAAGLAADASGEKWVYVEGQNASDYAGNITLTNAEVLWGSGYNGGFKGLSVSGVYPVLNGNGITADGITLVNNNTVMGLKIENFTNDGITFTNGTTLETSIIGNTINSNGHDGIDFSHNTGNMSHVTIANNTINSNGNDGIDLVYNGYNGTGTMSNFTISNNTANNNGATGIDLSNNGHDGTGTMTNFTISNNTANSNGTDGIDLVYNGYNTSGTMTDFTIFNNIANSNSNDGIDLAGNGFNGSGTMTNFTIFYNTTDNNNNNGIDLAENGQAGTGTMTDFTISNNTANSNANDGISLGSNGTENGVGTMTDFTILHNTTDSNNADGIDLSYNGGNIGSSDGVGTMTNFTISYNMANGNTNDGIDLSLNAGSAIGGSGGSGTMTNFTISYNMANGNTNDGIDLSFNGGVVDGGTGGIGTMTDFTISYNIANDNTNDGIDLSHNGGTFGGGTGGTGIMEEFAFTYNTINNNSNIANGRIDQSSNSGTMSGFTVFGNN